MGIEMQITDVRQIRVSFGERQRPIRNAILTYAGQGVAIVEVVTDEGIVGQAFGGRRDYVEGPLKGAVVGEDLFHAERLWERMYSSWRKPVAKGDVISSIGAVDIAIWDAIGKALDMPLYKVLGGFQDRVPVYAAGGYYQEGKGIDELVAEMVGYVEMGHRVVKMKVGGASLAEDVERVSAVVDAVGPEVRVMVDANNAWCAYEAIRFGRAVEDLDLYWLEEPVSPDDIEGHIEVKQALDIPIAAGENEYTRFGCRELIVNRAVDILQADVVTAGGITEWRKIAAMAGAYHVPMAPHGSLYMSIHALASIPNALIAESYPGVGGFMADLVQTPPVENGHVTVPDLPGLGLVINEEMVAKYRVR
ncbi:MAG: mandelate racemase/muconate lactonizing enzyme family protein [Planctomycetota bacterium]